MNITFRGSDYNIIILNIRAEDLLNIKAKIKTGIENRIKSSNIVCSNVDINNMNRQSKYGDYTVCTVIFEVIKKDEI